MVGSTTPTTDIPLELRLATLKARYPDARVEPVADIVAAILSTLDGDLGSREAMLLHEIGSLGELVAEARHEIVSLKVDDITLSHIPRATDELDAIVAHTATATHAILAACEALDALSGVVEEDAALRLQDSTMRIYEACSFQDITGQRVTKVVATLKTIESRIAAIVERFGAGLARPEAPVEDVPGLLNGPQLPMAAMDQADIDRLLASFD